MKLSQNEYKLDGWKERIVLLLVIVLYLLNSKFMIHEKKKKWNTL